MKIIVFGGTGRTGIEVVKQGLGLGHTITAYIRNPEKINIQHPNLKIVIGNVFDKTKVSEAIKNHDAVITCLGGDNGTKKSTDLTVMTKNIVIAMKENEIDRIGYMASAGIMDEIPGFFGKFVTFILRHALSDHKGAVDYITTNNLKYTIARPMALTDGPCTKNYRIDLKTIPNKGRNISRADVAHFLLKSITEERHSNSSVALAY